MTAATATTAVSTEGHSTATSRGGGVRSAVFQRWPTLAGLAFAAVIAIDLRGGVELAPMLAIVAAIYVGAAAFQRRGAAWPLLLVTSLILTVVKLLDPPVDPTWVILAVAVLMVVYGLARGAWRPAGGLVRQSVALLLFSAIALAALAVNAELGSYLVAAGLAGHAGWDALHHRTGRVVPRTYAEFCFVLDLVLAVAIVVVTVVN